jgi:hypothetical protein
MADLAAPRYRPQAHLDRFFKEAEAPPFHSFVGWLYITYVVYIIYTYIYIYNMHRVV